MPTRKQRELREKAAQVRTNGEYNEDAAAWLDRWMMESDEGTRNDRECMAFDAMLDAYGLGGIPSGQWNSLFDHATRINTIFEKATTWMNEAMMGEVTNYSPTATFDEVILTGIELLKPDGADGDPTGIHAEPDGTLSAPSTSKANTGNGSSTLSRNSQTGGTTRTTPRFRTATTQ